jgi:putative ABC transport system ATP-binding protein
VDRQVTAALEAESLHRFFHAGDEETQALRGVSITIEPGEFVAVIGPSGSGKSTLLSCLAGLDEPDGGTVRVAGTRITRRPEAERARLRAQLIGVLTQTGNLLAHLSVAQNIDLARRLAGRPRADKRADLLDSLGIGRLASAQVEQLSGGEAVRAGLALALANEPAILLADEPTGELDGNTEGQVLELMRAFAKNGMSLLVASHSSRVSAAADRIITLADGQVA